MPKRRRGREPPPNLDNLTPSYPFGYLEHRRREYELFDALPEWARRVLRRTKHEYAVAEVSARIKRGDSPLDITHDLEQCEASLSRDYLNQFTRKPPYG